MRKVTSETPVSCHGPGRASARRAAEELIDRRVSGLVSFGFAGGLDDSLEAGRIVLATQVRDGRYDYVETTAVWREDVRDALKLEAPAIEAPIAATDHIVREAAAKTKLKYQTDGVAVDMESIEVGRVARRAQLPFLVIRAISDPALQSLPIMAVDAVDSSGKVRPWRVLWSLLRHPGQIAELRRLAKNTGKATSALVQVAGQLAPQFCLRDYRGDVIRQLRAAGRLLP